MNVKPTIVRFTDIANLPAFFALVHDLQDKAGAKALEFIAADIAKTSVEIADDAHIGRIRLKQPDEAVRQAIRRVITLHDERRRQNRWFAPDSYDFQANFSFDRQTLIANILCGRPGYLDLIKPRADIEILERSDCNHTAAPLNFSLPGDKLPAPSKKDLIRHIPDLKTRVERLARRAAFEHQIALSSKDEKSRHKANLAAIAFLQTDAGATAIATVAPEFEKKLANFDVKNIMQKAQHK